MKSLLFLAALLCASTLLLPGHATAQQSQDLLRNRIKNADFVLSNNSTSKDFWFAIPLNTVKTHPTLALEIYVTSLYATTVTVEVPGTGFVISKKIKANDVAVFSSKDGSASFDWEVVSSQTPDNRGVHVTATEPVSVYVFNGKEVTSDGYLALPINSWGTEYIHCAYYDFNEYAPLGAGFLVVAAHDKTSVTVNLKGRGKSFAKTRSGSKIGEALQFNLDKGQVYNVVGDATTIGTFDLTGTIISADKPIGVISYHERTLLPQNSQNGRDHMVEMLRPTSAWGTKHVNLEFLRDNKGDFFRIVAAENNTTWSMKYYSKTKDTLLGQRQGKLNKGEFYEDFNEWAGRGAIEGIRGVSIWDSDKPTMVMHYQYSANWDRGDNFDPDMVLSTPYEQYQSSSVFQTPANVAFVNNWFNYIVEGDPNDSTSAKLKSLVIDGDSVYKSYPQLLENRIPTTNLYWGFKAMSPGAHVVSSATKFGGYVYGFGPFNGYSWPAGTATRALDTRDTSKPKLQYERSNADLHVTAIELERFGAVNDTNQYDQGIFDVVLIDSLSYNYKLTYLTSPQIIPLPRVTEFKFDITVIDKTKPAYAAFAVLDRAGNYVIDTIGYTPTIITAESPVMNFGKVRVGSTKTKTYTIENPNAKPTLITDVKLVRNQAYTIVSGNVPKQFSIPANGKHTVTISCKPGKEGISDDDTQLEIDSLLISTDAATFSFPLKTRGVQPCADVEAKWIAPATAIGDTIYRESTGLGLLIRNKGTDTLTVTGINGVKPPFFVQIQNLAFPFVVPPGGDVFFSSIGFAPIQPGADTVIVQFSTNSASQNCNTLSTWIGKGTPVSVEDEVLSRDWEITSTGNSIIAQCSCSDAPAAVLTLYDRLGRTICVQSGSTARSGLLIADNLSSGVYLARLSVQGRTLTSVLLLP
ncbi:MAG: hypothetical protein U0264_01505 [Candidatus Kapaibacterium sp.]